MYVLYKSTDAIEVIYLGDPTNNYKSIFTLTTIKEDAMRSCRQQSRIFSSSDFEIESIHVISKAESKRIHLMAITITGFRLYFSHHRDSFRVMGGINNFSAQPTTLELGHVRMPPPVLTRPVGQLAPTYVQTYYDCGICISVCPKTDTSATLRIDSMTSGKSATTTQPPSSNIGMMTMVRNEIYNFFDRFEN